MGLEHPDISVGDKKVVFIEGIEMNAIVCRNIEAGAGKRAAFGINTAVTLLPPGTAIDSVISPAIVSYKTYVPVRGADSKRAGRLAPFRTVITVDPGTVEIP